MRHVQKADRVLDAELALDPESPAEAAFVKLWKRAVDDCVSQLQRAKAGKQP